MIIKKFDNIILIMFLVDLQLDDVLEVLLVINL